MRRVRQLYNAVFAKLDPHDLAYIHNLLDKPAQEGFFRMAVCDQSHCLDTAYSVLSAASSLGLTDSILRHLQQAALLHDVGKSVGSVGVVARVVYVLVETWSSLQIFRYFGLDLQLRILAEHPKNGAQILSSIGVDPVVVKWVRDHHQPKDRYSRLLAVADSRN